MNQQVKIIGTNGQLSLGKEFAGKMVLVDQIDNSTWIIKSGEFVPDSEKWLYTNDNSSKIDQAVDWALKNQPSENFNEAIQRIEDELHKN